MTSPNNGWKPPQTSLDTDYQLWIQVNEPDYASPSILKDDETFPFFTIVTPVKDPPLSIMKATVQSVLAQSYQH